MNIGSFVIVLYSWVRFCSEVKSLSLTLKPQVRVRAKISSDRSLCSPKVVDECRSGEDGRDERPVDPVERTGIHERHIAEKGVATSDLAVEAAKRVPGQAWIEASEVEAILVATVTPDMMFPATACLVQDKLGAKGAWGFDLSAACSGFPYALQVGAKLRLRAAPHKGNGDRRRRDESDPDYTDRSTCILCLAMARARCCWSPAKRVKWDWWILKHEIDGSGAASLYMPVAEA